MKTTLETTDIEQIAERVVELIKPMLSRHQDTRQEDTIYDVKGLCEYLKVTPKWIHTRTYLKEIPYYKLSNKQLRFRKKGIDKWLESIKTPELSIYTGKLKAIR